MKKTLQQNKKLTPMRQYLAAMLWSLRRQSRAQPAIIVPDTLARYAALQGIRIRK